MKNTKKQSLTEIIYVFKYIDHLATQLIRRNDEVSLLHEKIKTLTTTLARAEIDYQHKINEVNLFKRQNRNLRRELEISKNFRETAHKLAREIVNLNKELLREKNLVNCDC